LTAAALGVVAVIVLVGAGLNKPMLLLPIAVIVLGVAGVRWLFAVWPRRRGYAAGTEYDGYDEPVVYEEPANGQDLPTYDQDRWAQAWPGQGPDQVFAEEQPPGAMVPGPWSRGVG
jgi:hypothetical protein